jgi:hypothetical protein
LLFFCCQLCFFPFLFFPFPASSTSPTLNFWNSKMLWICQKIIFFVSTDQSSFTKKTVDQSPPTNSRDENTLQSPPRSVEWRPARTIKSLKDTTLKEREEILEMLFQRLRSFQNEHRVSQFANAKRLLILPSWW